MIAASAKSKEEFIAPPEKIYKVGSCNSARNPGFIPDSSRGHTARDPGFIPVSFRPGIPGQSIPGSSPPSLWNARGIPRGIPRESRILQKVTLTSFSSGCRILDKWRQNGSQCLGWNFEGRTCWGSKGSPHCLSSNSGALLGRSLVLISWCLQLLSRYLIFGRDGPP